MLPELLLESAPLLVDALSFLLSEAEPAALLSVAAELLELPDADELELGDVMVPELGDVVLELVDDGVVVPAPDEEPAAVLLPELVHAAAKNAAATATPITFKFIRFLRWVEKDSPAGDTKQGRCPQPLQLN